MSRGARYGLVVSILLTVFLAGCSSMKKSHRLNLTPFAENTIALAGDIGYGLSEVRPVYLRDYRNLPEIVALRAKTTGIRQILKGVVAYSVEVVTLSGSTMSGPERCVALGEFLDYLLRPVLVMPTPNLNLTEA